MKWKVIILSLIALSAVAAERPIVKEGKPRELIGPEAKAVAVTLERLSKDLPSLPLELSFVRVESRGEYLLVSWGVNNANTRDGGVTYHVDSKTFLIVCSEIDGKPAQSKCR